MQMKKEYEMYEEQYKQALRDVHKCQIEEINIDQDDMLRTSILELLLYDIGKKYYPFKDDVHNQKQLHFNTALDQKEKLELVEKHKIFTNEIKQIYGKGYSLFNDIMKIITAESIPAYPVQQKPHVATDNKFNIFSSTPIKENSNFSESVTPLPIAQSTDLRKAPSVKS